MYTSVYQPIYHAILHHDKLLTLTIGMIVIKEMQKRTLTSFCPRATNTKFRLQITHANQIASAVKYKTPYTAASADTRKFFSMCCAHVCSHLLGAQHAREKIDTVERAARAVAWLLSGMDFGESNVCTSFAVGEAEEEDIR